MGRTLRTLTVLSVALWALGATPAVAGAIYDRMHVFGDSLSDTGNVFLATGGAAPPSPPYYNGRFSDGPVWSEQFAAALGLQLTALQSPSLNPVADNINFAFGSAQTGGQNRVPDNRFPPPDNQVPGLLGQVSIYTQTLPVDPDALHVVWSGANDYILPFYEPIVFGTVFDTYAQPDTVTTIGNIAAAIGLLAAEGVTDILVPNLPDLGAVPLGARLPDLLADALTPAEIDTLLGGAATAAEALTDFAVAHNAALDSTLDQLAGNDPSLNLIPFDVFTLFADVFAAPADFGLSDVSNGVVEFCLFDNVVEPDVDNCALPPVVPTGYAFYDEQHPSAQMHAIIADAALDAVGVPEPVTLLMVGAGLAFIGIAARRRAVARSA